MSGKTLLAGILAAVLSMPGLAFAQAAEPKYPTRPIRLIVPWPTGGGADALARIISPKLSDAMGQSWVVDNRGGAAGNLGGELVARANPDGHTVLLALDSSLTANPNLYDMTFSVEKDLQPVTLLATLEQIMVIHPGVPARTLKEFIELAKQKPGTFNFASTGMGSSPHLIVELLMKRTGINMVHVPYKGGGPATAAVLSGEAHVLIGSVASTIQFVKSGQLRALATMGPKRSKLTPELPTIAESGYPGFEVLLWDALLVPSATPRSIVERIRSEAIKVVQQPDVQAALARLGMDPATSTVEELAARIKRDTGQWASVIKDAGIRIE